MGGWSDPWVPDLGPEDLNGYLALYDLREEGVPSPGLEIGDWALVLSEEDTRRLVELLHLPLAETLFKREKFHLPGDVEEIGKGGGPLDLIVELDRDGLHLELWQLGSDTGWGVTIPHHKIAEVAAAARRMSSN